MFRRLLIIVIVAGLSLSANAQFGVAFHQGNLPFFDFNYQLDENFGVSLRVGSDNYIENLGYEAAFTYNFISKDDYIFYMGVGGRFNVFDGIVIPVGLQFFPFENKKFGFHGELTPMAVLTEANSGVLLRGTWGIRYRFMKE
jgi:hypothetical protein